MPQARQDILGVSPAPRDDRGQEPLAGNLRGGGGPLNLYPDMGEAERGSVISQSAACGIPRAGLVSGT